MAVDPVSLAVTAALMAAQMAMQASQEIEGPRMQDLTATVADYGTPLNNCYGRRWLTCPCFYAEDIRERKKKRKTKGGKYNEYTYFGTFAVHIADHAISGVRKIKFDGHLVYDATASGAKIYKLDDDYDLSSNMRIYYGSATQEPDPRMLASTEAKYGPGTCPAYRGQSYLFLEDIPLEKVGNRMPIVSVEVSRAPAQMGGEDGNGVPVGSGGGDGGDTEYMQIGWAYRQYQPEPSNFPSGSNTGSPTYIETAVQASRYPVPWDDSVYNAGKDAEYDAFVAAAELPLINIFTGYYAGDFYAANDPSYWLDETQIAYAMYYAGYGFEQGRYLVDMEDRTRVNHPTQLTILYTPGSNWAYEKHQHVGVGAFIPVYDSQQVIEIEAPPLPWFWSSSDPVEEAPLPEDDSVPLSAILMDIARRVGMVADDYDVSQTEAIIVTGFNWSQSSAKQIVGPLQDVYDFDFRPHDFLLEAVRRGGESLGTITDFAQADPLYRLPSPSDTDLPRRIFLNFADVDADQQTNTAVSQRRGSAVDGVRDLSIDMTKLALNPDEARQFADRYLRRKWFGITQASNSLPRRDMGIEPGDVWTPVFGNSALTMRSTRVVIPASGALEMEWEADAPELAVLSGAAGAGADGIPPAEIYTLAETEGAVMDLPLLVDAHDQTTPFAYIAAGPLGDEGAWPGADFAQSDTGDEDTFELEWDGIDSLYEAYIGTVGAALPDAKPWNVDNASTIEVVLNSGELVSATLDDLIDDGTLNLALIGEEIVQFQTATLTDDLTYTLSGFLRGVRGTERAMPGHVAGERFVLLDAAKKHTMGASEIGDTDSYIAHTVGRGINTEDAFDVAFTGAAHRPYAAVHGSTAQSGADWLFDAVRRTRIGATTLNGQDVPLGEASEAWELDILDGGTVVRTLTGTSLPITYAEGDQITDFGAPLGTAPDARLYQMNPTLNLRGYPLTF
ncbi:phage tail protein [Croceicoccus naphthovorans]|uniref:Uncharacterized protein n=1 Tax=Croceicoccus naphthovorans TaxID=1348774 RepID=A0A0G3XF93_9SPHN|nr:phage tail protein [Croceicoccus naphthovorans]AKM09882.1 hypothetical protein AB433_07615 [Croceicoccus naphthovorans]MBB3991343.1 hypothetical protein [Croceicoccus naphthovorans]